MLAKLKADFVAAKAYVVEHYKQLSAAAVAGWVGLEPALKAVAVALKAAAALLHL